ncbi:MAG: hypothetical protein IKP37_05360 [Paludibacteraceae bacterium]|nr:hypothetical protein [Paludibacteraceae bacterium]
MKEKIKHFLSKFSFRTGGIVLALCVPCYILAFLPLLFQLDNKYRFALWFVFFGLAKTFQYTGLTIIGAEGLKRLKDWWKNRKTTKTE